MCSSVGLSRRGWWSGLRFGARWGGAEGGEWVPEGVSAVGDGGGEGETIRRSFAAWSTAARHVAGGPRSVVGMMMGDKG